MEKCFIIMPISTPENVASNYKGDEDHFEHVLDHLFIPALKKAGFEPIPPKSTGSNVIQADIIKNLSTSEMVLCDMSILNPNVFFEFGIRTALDMPISLVTDDNTTNIPFDTSIISFHRYKSAMNLWEIENEIKALAEHVKMSSDKGKKRNALWKYFGVAQTGVFKPEDASIGEKLDLLVKEIESLKSLNAKDKRNVPRGLIDKIDYESLRNKRNRTLRHLNNIKDELSEKNLTNDRRLQLKKTYIELSDYLIQLSRETI